MPNHLDYQNCFTSTPIHFIKVFLTRYLKGLDDYKDQLQYLQIAAWSYLMDTGNRFYQISSQ